MSKPSSWPPRTQQLRFILSGKWDYPEGLWLQGRTPNLHWRVFLPGPLRHAICNDIERGGCRDTGRLTSSGQFAHKSKRQVSRSPQMTAQPQSLFPDTGLWQSKMCKGASPSDPGNMGQGCDSLFSLIPIYHYATWISMTSRSSEECERAISWGLQWIKGCELADICWRPGQDQSTGREQKEPPPSYLLCPWVNPSSTASSLRLCLPTFGRTLLFSLKD